MYLFIQSNKKAVDQATAIEPLYNDSLSKIYYTKKLGKSLYIGGIFLYDKRILQLFSC